MAGSYTVPYTTKLETPLSEGQTINIKGKVADGAQTLEFNFLRGHSDLPAAEAILHIKFLFKDGKVVFNSFIEQKWGKEERVSTSLKPGQEYDLRIRALKDNYEIRLNGDKLEDFKHRLPFDSTQFFQVKGEVTLDYIFWGGRVYTLPWETGFPNGASMPAGQKIHIYAIPTGNRWAVDFIARNGDILFHWNPRFDEKAIVRNGQKGGTWGAEEREGPFPFKKGHGNDILIVNEPYSIQVSVDGHQIGTFQHRTENPAQDYIGFRINGDVDVTNIDFKQTQ